MRTRWLLPFVSLILGFGSASPSHAATFNELCTRLPQEAGAAGVEMAVVVIDLASGEHCGMNSEQTFLTASLYKLFVLVEAFEQRAAGRFSFGEPLLLEPRHGLTPIS